MFFAVTDWAVSFFGRKFQRGLEGFEMGVDTKK